MPYETLQWIGDVDGHLRLIDQTRLPREFEHVDCRDVQAVWDAIRRLVVRGAPAIGVAAGYGVCLGAGRAVADAADGRAVADAAREAADRLRTSRPTAVNLFWALDRMRAVADSLDRQPKPLAAARRLLDEARAIHDEDRRLCASIGRHGGPLLDGCRGVLTHCNAGPLATGGDGTALSVIFAASRANPALRVFVDETRPLWQGARLTAWELQQRGVPATLICDSMAGQVMKEGRVDAVVVGADRITARGDAANKIGTYAVAVLAQHHGIPFYVAAPASTFDLALADGDEVPIEQRGAAEVTQPAGVAIAPDGIDVYNPAFDVTPAELITAIITDRGVVRPVTDAAIRTALGAGPESVAAGASAAS